MVCKNCGASLRSDFRYCPECGAKVIRNRLTIKNIWQDLSFQVFNLDNTFFKTFTHLFSKPEYVVESFISGTRKKYMNPVSYFAIAITLTGVLYFVLRNVYDITLTQTAAVNPNAPNMDFIFDYQGLMSYLFMPVYAGITWLLFLDKGTLNYTEHLVANAYATGQTSFVQVFICLIIFGLFDVPFDIFNWVYMLFMTAYLFHVFARIYKIGFFSALVRGLGYVILFGVTMLAIGIVMASIFFATGHLNIEDFKPQG